MNFPIEALNSIIVAIGIPSIVMGMIYIGRKLEKLDHIDRTVGKIQRNIRVLSSAMISGGMPLNIQDLEG